MAAARTRRPPYLIAAALSAVCFSVFPSVSGWSQPGEFTGDFDVDGVAGPRDLQQLIDAFGLPVASGTGNLLWVRRAFGLSFKAANDVSIRSNGEIVFTGTLSNGTTFGEGEPTQTTINTSGSFASYTATYEADGGFVRVRNASNGSGNGIALHPEDGSAWTTGQFTSTATFGLGGATQTMATGDFIGDVFLSSENAAGDLVFVRPAGGSGYHDSFGVSVLGDGTSVQLGVMDQAATFGVGDVTLTLTPQSSRNIFIVKYNPDLSPAWGKALLTTVFDDGMDVELLPDGDVLACSDYRNMLVFGEGEPGETTLQSVEDEQGFSSRDAFIVRYNDDGTLDWVISEGGEGDDRAVGLGILPNDAGIAVGGTYEGEITFGAGGPNERTLLAEGSRDVYVARYTLDGEYQWARGAAGPGLQNLTCIGTTPDGGIVIGGAFENSVIFGLGEANQTTLVSDGGVDGFLAKYSGEGDLLWVKRMGGAGDDRVLGLDVDANGEVVAVGTFTQTATFGLGEDNQTMLESGGNTPSITSIFVARFEP